MNKMKAAFPAEFKALGDEQGTVEAMVSVYGNVDLQGDRVLPGAFAKSIADWKAQGDPIPVVISHDYGDLWQHIGAADPNDVVETDAGLKIRYTVDIKDNPVAAQAYRLMKRRTLRNHSFTYDVRDFEMKSGVRELKELGLLEFGPTLLGANPQTDVLAVKSALEEHGEHENPTLTVTPLSTGATSTANTANTPVFLESKAGRRISKATAAKLQHLQEHITELLEEDVIEEGKSLDLEPGDGTPVIDEDLLRIRVQLQAM